MEDVKNVAYDEEGFKTFFQTHPNDATIEELPPDSTNDAGTETDTPAAGTQDEDQVDTPASSTTPDADPSEQTSDNDAANGTASSDSKVTKTANADTKQAQAFAQLRIANQQQQQLLRQIAGVVGVTDTKDPAAMMNALQQLAIKAQSQQQGIPEEVLTRLNHLEHMNTEFQRQQAYLAAGRGFQTIKDKYGLDNDALEAFAQELIADGLNPYEQRVNLVNEYKLRHFDSMLEQAVQKGIDQEAQRAAKAGAQSSTPTTTSGGRADSETPKINSVAELNKWLEDNK